MTSREAFEKWCDNIGHDRRTKDGEYIWENVRYYWKIWQASRAQALEDAARRLDSMNAELIGRTGHGVQDYAVSAIRQMKDKK